MARKAGKAEAAALQPARSVFELAPEGHGFPQSRPDDFETGDLDNAAVCLVKNVLGWAAKRAIQGLPDRRQPGQQVCERRYHRAGCFLWAAKLKQVLS